MSDGPIIRPIFSALLFKAETTEGVDSVPTAADVIGIENESFTWSDPFTTEASSESRGDLVRGPELVIGQPVTISFRSRIRGANQAYTALIRPPQHALLQACGRRGVFTAAVAATAVATGGVAPTLAAPFVATDQAYVGMPLVASSGPNNGFIGLIRSYTAARVAALASAAPAAYTVGDLVAIPANWTYAGTSPRSVSDRATDHPSGTAYWYEDGKLWRFAGLRGQVNVTGQSAREGFFEWTFTGVFLGDSDAALPANLAPALQTGPLLLQGSGTTPAFTVNSGLLPISTFTLANGGALESPDDPNTPAGFDPAVIGARAPSLTCDPLGTTKAARDSIGQIQNGTQFPGAIYFAGGVGNRFAITLPILQRTQASPGTRGALRSEQSAFRAISGGRDSNTRDTDSVWAFW